jgi:hypothetical protein
VTPLNVPVTEPRPVLEPLLLLLPSLLEPVMAGRCCRTCRTCWPRREPETEFRPGRLLLAGLLACIGPLAWIMLLPVVDEDDEVPQDAPTTLAATATPDTGRDRPQRTPLAELSPLSETGASCACANAGAATPAVRMAAEAAPPSKIRQLYTKHSISMW